MTPAFGLVALPLPLAQPYSYRIPESLADRVVPGARVVVPVRQRELVGVVVALTDEAPPQAARDLPAAPDDEPALPAALLATPRWHLAYYGDPPGSPAGALLPGAPTGATAGPRGQRSRGRARGQTGRRQRRHLPPAAFRRPYPGVVHQCHRCRALRAGRRG